MKKAFYKLKTLAVAMFFGTAVFAGAPDANVQVIHNCADPAADTVDVWVDLGMGQMPYLTNFAFRTATPYSPVPSNTTFQVFVKPQGSSISTPALATFTLGPLSADSNYVVIASGVVGSGFAANPNGLSTAFDLKVIANSKTTSPAGTVTFAAFHGATDAPGVDVRIRNGGPLLVNNLKYGSSQGWLTVPASWYQLEVIAEDSSAVVNTWIANFSGAAGLGVVVFASGFLTPSANNNGAAFGLFAALPNGTVIELPVRQTAKVQLVHNSPVPVADSVDVYVNGQLGFPNLKFRGATPFIDITANFPIQLGLAPGNSTSFADTIKTWLYFFTPNTNYVMMATGVVGTGYAANPNGVSIDLDVVQKTGAVISTGDPNTVSFAVAHGATDAPSVDVRVRNGGPLLVNNAKYKDVTNYITVPAGWYQLEVIAADSSSTVNTWIANLSGIGGSGAFVFASGFLNPAANNNGPAFGLYAALPTGQVLAFPIRKTATVQFVHNAYDPAVDTVDVYINGNKQFDNFVYKNSTPALGIMTADFPINIAFAPQNSTNVNDTIWQKTYFFNAGTNYVGIAQGLVGTGFAANPDGVNTAFDLLIKTPAQTASTNPSQFQFFVVHGSTDAPTVDVKVVGGSTIVDNAKYNDMTPYIGVPGDNYTLQITDASGNTVVKTYEADVTTLNGTAGTVLASGFLNPAANNNGPAFGLYLITSAGGPFLPLPEVTSVIDLADEIGMKMFPNPANSTLNFTFNLKQAGEMAIQITDINGRVVSQVINTTLESGSHTITADLSNLTTGLYIAKVVSGEKAANIKFNVSK